MRISCPSHLAEVVTRAIRRVYDVQLSVRIDEGVCTFELPEIGQTGAICLIAYAALSKQHESITWTPDSITFT